MDPSLMTDYIHRGFMTVNDARAELGYWPLNLPSANLPSALKRQRCSYCKFLAEGDRCRNCGAPQ